MGKEFIAGWIYFRILISTIQLLVVQMIFRSALLFLLFLMPVYAVSQDDAGKKDLLRQINEQFIMNRNKEALRTAEDAIASYPDEPEFHYFRGVIYNAMEKYGKALDAFDRGLELKPAINAYKYYLGRGVSHMNLAEYDQSLSDLSTAIEMNDTVASAYHCRARVNYELKEYATAVQDFLKALEFSQGNAALYFNLGMSYFRLDEKEKACPYFHKACTMGNNNACRMALMECAKAIPAVQ